MKKSRKVLSVISWLYVIATVLTIGLMVLCLYKPSIIAEVVMKVNFRLKISDDVSLKALVTVYLAIIALKDFWFAWLFRRVATGKSRGTVLMVLFILSILGSVIGMFNKFNLTILISTIIDVIIVALIIKSRDDEY